MSESKHDYDKECGCEWCEEYARQKAEDDAVDRYIEDQREGRDADRN